MAIKWLSFTLLLSTIFSATMHATTYTAASCNQSDVNAVINGPTHTAVAGDTIIIPNGSCTWTSPVAVTVPITLQGASVGGVTITDNDTNAADSLLTMTTGTGAHLTIANLNFLPGTATGNYIALQDGAGTPLVPLMHDMTFNLPNFQLTRAVQWFVTGGVIWNTTFISTYNLSGACGSQVGSDSGSLGVKSNLSWDYPSTMGTLDDGTHNLYIEDSTFSNVGQIPDADDNSRVVLRHTQIIGSSGLIHGATSTYGGRFTEIYDNTFTYPNTNRNLNRYFWWRDGTAVVTGNSFQALTGGCYGVKPTLTFTISNAQRATSHNCCTGYMCYHQIGSGASSTVKSPSSVAPSQTPNDVYQLSDPVYIWGNTGTGQGSADYSIEDETPNGCTANINPSTGVEYQTSDFYKSGRDYFYDDKGSSTSGAKPGWTRYPYPHPLRNGTSPAPPPPSGLKAVVN